MTVDNFQRGIFTWPMNFGWKQIPQEVIEKNKLKETDIIRYKQRILELWEPTCLQLAAHSVLVL